MTAVREDIQRVKIAIDLAKRDILQKKQVSQEIKGEIEEIQFKNSELDEEISVYEQKFGANDNEMQSLIDQSNELDQIIQDKLALIDQLEDEIEKAESEKLLQEEQDKRDLYAEIESQRVQYQPIMSNEIDVLMGNALNACEYFVPTSRIKDGEYTFGTLKITVKV